MVLTSFTGFLGAQNLRIEHKVESAKIIYDISGGGYLTP